MEKQPPTRRDVLKKALYVAPVLLTLPAVLSFAQAGSGRAKRKNPQHWPPPGSEGGFRGDNDKDD